MKPHQELATFGSLCLPVGIFASHPCQAKRHPCLLLRFRALYFAFFLNRDKTVKYFPAKSPHVICRAVHTIKLSFPSINLHLTSLPQALSEPLVPPLQPGALSGECLCHSGAGHAPGEPSGEVGMENWAEFAPNYTAQSWMCPKVRRKHSSDKICIRGNLDFNSVYEVFYEYCEIFKIIKGSWLRSTGLFCCNSFVLSGRASLWRIKSLPGEDQS